MNWMVLLQKKISENPYREAPAKPAKPPLAPLAGLCTKGFVKKISAAERPLIRCGDCAHFQPDTIGDGSGIGTCAQGIVPPLRAPAMYPRAPRCCGGFEHAH